MHATVLHRPLLFQIHHHKTISLFDSPLLVRNHHKSLEVRKSLLFMSLAIIAPALTFVNKILKTAEMLGFTFHFASEAAHKTT